MKASLRDTGDQIHQPSKLATSHGGAFRMSETARRTRDVELQNSWHELMQGHRPFPVNFDLLIARFTVRKISIELRTGCQKYV